MKIQRIKLFNIGPYVDENEFVFSTNDKEKRMVLIGGKNGAGKTTLFNAIKVCLYGCVAFGYETINSKYLLEIDKLVNSTIKLQKNSEAEVELDLLLDDGKYNDVYTFIRKWKIGSKRIAEVFEVRKNNRILSVTEKEDFENYILHLLPPNLFRFYFFDGEKLSDFVFNGNKDSDFKEAFLKLCNLDTMEIIRENFRRISRNNAKDNSSFSHEYEVCLKEDALAACRVEHAEDEYKSIELSILAIDEQLVQLEKAYAKGGGISKKEWRSMQEQISKEEVRREEKRKWLKDIANNVLPFIILRNNLLELKEQIVLEHKSQMNLSLRTTIDTPEIRSIISAVLKDCGMELSEDITEKIISDISNYSAQIGNAEAILNLSDLDRFEIIAKINNLLAFDANRIKEATEDIEASLKCVKRIRKKIERSSIESYDEYLQKKSELNEQRAKLTQQLLELDKELQQLRAHKAISASKLSKAKATYEAFLKKQSINDIAARALLAFEELQEILYKKSIRAVELEFGIRFSSLINKSDLIDGIHIDQELNVLPYKNKKFVTQELRKSLLTNGAEYIIAQIGLYAYEVLQKKLLTEEEEIELPVEVKQQLSAGEKQIFVMALYQSLSQLNKINVPYIIDTPFARIDGEHREKILRRFFKELKGQIIILSTDEEIVSNYKEVVSDIISDTFVLDHTIGGKTAIRANAYFGENL